MSIHKSDFIAIAQRICNVCGQLYSTNEVLQQNNFSKKFKEGENILGYGICNKHQKLYKAGYLALVVINPPNDTKALITQKNADRTGEIIHIKYAIFNHIITGDLVDSEKYPMTFINPGFAQKLKDFIKAHTKKGAIHANNK